MKKNKKIFAGMAVLVLLFGLIGCLGLSKVDSILGDPSAVPNTGESLVIVRNTTNYTIAMNIMADPVDTSGRQLRAGVNSNVKLTLNKGEEGRFILPNGNYTIYADGHPDSMGRFPGAMRRIINNITANSETYKFDLTIDNIDGQLVAALKYLDPQLIGIWGVEVEDHTRRASYIRQLIFEEDGKLGESQNTTWFTSGGVITLISPSAFSDYTWTAKYKITGNTLVISESTSNLLTNGTYRKMQDNYRF